jgi:hypothetical protein
MKTFIISAFLALMTAAKLQATVLTFDITGLTDFFPAPQAYGDNVTSATMGAFSYGTTGGFTPNITTTYGNTQPTLWTTGYGDLSNVLFEDQDNTGVLNITFSADPGFLVRLHSFDLAAYNPAFGSDPTITSVTVFNSLNVALFTRANASISEITRTPFTFATPLSDTSLRIEIDARNLGGLNDDIGADNITFSQSIPEPSAVALLTFGFGALSLSRRHAKVTCPNV